MHGSTSESSVCDFVLLELLTLVASRNTTVEKYQDLSQELAKPWIIKLTVVPVVIGALGIVSGKLARHLKMTGVTIKIELL